jgi:hypothetical protein
VNRRTGRLRYRQESGHGQPGRRLAFAGR